MLSFARVVSGIDSTTPNQPPPLNPSKTDTGATAANASRQTGNSSSENQHVNVAANLDQKEKVEKPNQPPQNHHHGGRRNRPPRHVNDRDRDRERPDRKPKANVGFFFCILLFSLKYFFFVFFAETKRFSCI